MAIIPTVKELTAIFLSNLESKLNQNSPLNNISFLRVLAINQALVASSIYRMGIREAAQNLVITATGERLELLGAEYNIFKKKAQTTILEISLPATNGTIVPVSRFFVGDNNSIRYFPEAPATASGGAAILVVAATENPGTVANLLVGETMSINSGVAGAETVATVTAINQLGTEEENQEIYRGRVQLAIRKKSGGATSSDIREWGEAVPGVKAVYPYTGLPYDDPNYLTPNPLDRTVYVESADDPDGIAPLALLEAVKAALIANPETGKSRLTLGTTAERLYVVSIRRTSIYVTIRNLTWQPGQETTVKTQIESAITADLLLLRPFIQGLDVAEEANNSVSDLFISAIIGEILKTNNAKADGVGFGFTPAVFEPFYDLGEGELTKVFDPGGVIYA